MGVWRVSKKYMNGGRELTVGVGGGMGNTSITYFIHKIPSFVNFFEIIRGGG